MIRPFSIRLAVVHWRLPIGVGFFIACGIARISVDRASGAMMPYVVMMCLGLLVVILVPWVTLVLPRLLRLG